MFSVANRKLSDGHHQFYYYMMCSTHPTISILHAVSHRTYRYWILNFNAIYHNLSCIVHRAYWNKFRWRAKQNLYYKSVAWEIFTIFHGLLNLIFILYEKRKLFICILYEYVLVVGRWCFWLPGVYHVTAFLLHKIFHRYIVLNVERKQWEREKNLVPQSLQFAVCKVHEGVCVSECVDNNK